MAEKCQKTPTMFHLIQICQSYSVQRQLQNQGDLFSYQVCLFQILYYQTVAENFFFILFPATMNFCYFSPPSKVSLQADQEVKFELKNSSLETLYQNIPRYPWLLNILIHYTFLNTLGRFVFHLQSACELSVCFQRGHCFN